MAIPAGFEFTGAGWYDRVTGLGPYGYNGTTMTLLSAGGAGGDATAANQASQIALATTLATYVDGLETLITTLNGYVDGLEALLTTQAGYLDGVETKLDTLHADVTGSDGQLPTALDATSGGLKSSGDVAHDGADLGNPQKIGGQALSANPTAVATGDRVNALFDLIGRLVTAPYSIPENIVSGAITTAMTGTTSTSLIAAPAAGLRNYITSIVVSNAHATVGTDVVIQDGSGGATLMTIPAAAVYGGAVINLPVPLRQPTTATAIFCANVTTGASTKVSAVGYKAA